jgi:hypothetical protein
MKFSQFIFIPVIVAFLAFTIQIVDQLLSPMMPIEGNVGFGWIAFIAWAMYFMAGCTPEGGRKTFFGYIAGIIAAVAIMECGGALASLGFMAFPVAIFFVVIPCICLEKVPLFDFVPALFVGAGTFFGIMSYVGGATYVTATITELVYCVLGLVYGLVTIILRSRYEAYVESYSHASDLHVSK